MPQSRHHDKYQKFRYSIILDFPSKFDNRINVTFIQIRQNSSRAVKITIQIHALIIRFNFFGQRILYNFMSFNLKSALRAFKFAMERQGVISSIQIRMWHSDSKYVNSNVQICVQLNYV